MNAPVSADPRCTSCWQRKSAHVGNERGALECPPITRYFTPCQHKSSQGWGQIGSDGSYDSETWCTTCGEQLTFRKVAS